MFWDIDKVEVIADDLLIWEKLNEISYIGHILSKDGLKSDPKKTRAAIDMPCPENRGAQQRFLVMLTYLGKFIPNLSHIASLF